MTTWGSLKEREGKTERKAEGGERTSDLEGAREKKGSGNVRRNEKGELLRERGREGWREGTAQKEAEIKRRERERKELGKNERKYKGYLGEGKRCEWMKQA